MTGQYITDVIKQEFLFAGNSFWCFKILQEFVQDSPEGTLKDGSTPLLFALEQSFVISICKVGAAMSKKYGANFKNKVYLPHKELISNLRTLRDKYFAHIDNNYNDIGKIHHLILDNPYTFKEIIALLMDMSALIYGDTYPTRTFRTKDSVAFERIIERIKDERNDYANQESTDSDSRSGKTVQ